MFIPTHKLSFVLYVPTHVATLPNLTLGLFVLILVENPKKRKEQKQSNRLTSRYVPIENNTFYTCHAQPKSI
jgi:hypothetical protein